METRLWDSKQNSNPCGVGVGRAVQGGREGEGRFTNENEETFGPNCGAGFIVMCYVKPYQISHFK